MADRVIVVEVHEYPGHMRPGVRVGSTREYNPATKDQNTLAVYAAFMDDTDVAELTLYTDLNASVNTSASAAV